MSNARKLQTEIDRVMKKVDEGVELFDEIWEKVYSAEQQNQKEKYEMDLKKEIKKLQRLRDQIKTWIGGSDVKDKEPLIEARKLIETKMEQFKICEKETKTKTYSKEGLAREEKLDPAEEAKLNTTTWLGEYIEKLNQLVEETDFEIEKLSAGKGKKTNKHEIEALKDHIANHRFHINKLEGIIRLVNNDLLDVELVDNIKDDLDYYLTDYEDSDYMMAYDEEFFYESLGLEELDVVNVDRVTQAAAAGKKMDDATSTSSRGSKDKKASKKASLTSVIPLTIGRARSSKAERKAEKEREEAEKAATPSKVGRSNSGSSTQSGNNVAPAAAPPPVPVPTQRAPVPAAPPAGASMASVLKRDQQKEDQEKEKERQKLREQQQQQARAQAEQQLRQQQQQQAQRQQQEAQLRQQEALRQQQQQQAQQQEALKRQQQEAQLRQQQQQEAAAKQQQQEAQLQAQQQQAAAEQKAQKLQNQQMQSQSGQNSALDILTSGLGGLGLGGAPENRGDTGSLPMGASSGASQTQSGGGLEVGSTYLTALNDSFAATPGTVDNERSRQYTPQNPYPTPASYPSTPSAIFDNPAVFEKLGTDCLFFIFYYAQGTYQQYLAARELKKQSWRFHKKYMTWFQRHEEPKITTDEYEQGTYVYFDYETGWCTRIKTDFRFEYSFLEDSLQ